MTDTKMSFESERDPEERWMFSAKLKSWCGKLTFAISKQRLTLAGQEKAALGEKYRRDLY